VPFYHVASVLCVPAHRSRPGALVVPLVDVLIRQPQLAVRPLEDVVRPHVVCLVRQEPRLGRDCEDDVAALGV
jgi:hypothetical protein